MGLNLLRHLLLWLSHLLGMRHLLELRQLLGLRHLLLELGQLLGLRYHLLLLQLGLLRRWDLHLWWSHLLLECHVLLWHLLQGQWLLLDKLLLRHHLWCHPLLRKLLPITNLQKREGSILVQLPLQLATTWPLASDTTARIMEMQGARRSDGARRD